MHQLNADAQILRNEWMTLAGTVSLVNAVQNQATENNDIILLCHSKLHNVFSEAVPYLAM